MDGSNSERAGMRVLIRLDDFTPNSNRESWGKIGAILDDLRIKPLVAVVPEDRYFGPEPTTADFWSSVRELQAKGWSIGLHGETHIVERIPVGMRGEISFATKSEFIGLPLEAQLEKLRRAWATFVANGVRPVAFVAPNHGFDRITVEALSRHGQIRVVSDGVSLRPFMDRGLCWLPQVDWRMPKIPLGFRTVCLHPSTMSAADIAEFARSAERAVGSFVALDELDLEHAQPRTPGDAALEYLLSGYIAVKERIARLLAVRATRMASRA